MHKRNRIVWARESDLIKLLDQNIVKGPVETKSFHVSDCLLAGDSSEKCFRKIDNYARKQGYDAIVSQGGGTWAKGFGQEITVSFYKGQIPQKMITTEEKSLSYLPFRIIIYKINKK